MVQSSYLQMGAIVLRKFLLCMIAALLLIFPLCAQAEVSSNLVPLSISELLTCLESEGYQSGCLYQPSLREADPSENVLPELDMYPIVVRNSDGNYNLLIVKKQNGLWQVTVENEQALSREGLTLYDFSIEEADQMIYAYFSFVDGNGTESELGLQLSELYPSQFTFSHSGIYQIVFNYDRPASITIHAALSSRFSFDLHLADFDCDISRFSLSACPLSFDDVLSLGTEVLHNEGTALYMIPDDSMEPVFTLGESDTLFLLDNQVASEWAVVAYKRNIFFVHLLDLKTVGE